MLRPLVGAWFQVLFHSSQIEVLFTFPSRYWFAIGLSGVFSLTGWAPLIHTEFLVFRATQDTARYIRYFEYRTFTFCGQTFQFVLL